MDTSIQAVLSTWSDYQNAVLEGKGLDDRIHNHHYLLFLAGATSGICEYKGSKEDFADFLNSENNRLKGQTSIK